MNYIIFKKGVNPSQIVRTGFCPDEMMELQVQEGEMSIEGVANDTTQYIHNGAVTDYTPDQLTAKSAVPYGYTWDIATMTAIQTATDEKIAVRLATQARTKRDQLLTACDWTQTADQPESTKTKWQPYRQELRDITLQEGFPNNVIWPIKPS